MSLYACPDDAADIVACRPMIYSRKCRSTPRRIVGVKSGQTRVPQCAASFVGIDENAVLTAGAHDYIMYAHDLVCDTLARVTPSADRVNADKPYWLCERHKCDVV